MNEPPWFCIRAQPKREAVAAAQLATLPGVRVFFPRVQFVRRGKTGPKTTREALFPGYLFASFDFLESGKQVGYTRGVARIVRRTNLEPAEVPERVMQGLFGLAPDGLVRVGEPDFRVGDAVRVVAGVFAGNETTVVRLLPGAGRVAVLLRLLGQEQEILLDPKDLDLPESDPRRRIL